jgi:hypothetical protein
MISEREVINIGAADGYNSAAGCTRAMQKAEGGSEE